MPKPAIREDDLLKAMNDLEERAEKSEKIPDQMKNTRAANGGLSQDDSDEAEHMETAADTKDPTGASIGKGGKGIRKGKMPPPDDDSSDESDDESSASSDDSASKSLRESLAGDDEVEKAVEISSFLEHTVDRLSDDSENLHKAVSALAESIDEYNMPLRKAVIAMGNKILAIDEKLDQLLGAPANGGRPKSVLNKSETVDGPLGGGDGMTDLSKGDVENVLVEMGEKRLVTTQDVILYNSTGEMSPEVAKKIESYIQRRA